MYGCESWIIKKAECQRIDAFELWYWRRLLRVPWTARRSNQSILKEISPEYSLEGLMWSWNSNTLGTWCEEQLFASALVSTNTDSGKDWRQEEKGTTGDEMVGWHHWLDGHEFEQAPGIGDGQGSPVCCSPWGHKELDMTEKLNWSLNWVFLWGFPGVSDGKGSVCNAGDPGSIPGSGRSPGEGNGNPLQYSCLENPMDEEPGGLQSIGLQKVGHDWETLFTYLYARKKEL